MDHNYKNSNGTFWNASGCEKAENKAIQTKRKVKKKALNNKKNE